MQALFNRFRHSMFRTSSVDLEEGEEGPRDVRQLRKITPARTADYKTAETLQQYPRSGHRVWANDSYMFAVGGYNPTAVLLSPDQDEEEEQHKEMALLKEVWCLNLLTGGWSPVKTLGRFPDEVASFAMVESWQANTTVMVGGTAVPFGEASTNAVRLLRFLSPSTAVWIDVPKADAEDEANAPEPSYGQALCRGRDPNTYMVIGGTTGFHYNMNVHLLRIAHDGNNRYTAHWTRLSSSERQGAIVEPRYRHEIVIHGEEVLVFGGGTRTHDCSFNQLDAFNLSTNTWRTQRIVTTTEEEGEEYPQPRKCHSIVHDASTGRVYVIGGQNGVQPPPGLPGIHSPQPTVLSDVWSYNLSSKCWRKETTTLPKPLFFHASTMTPSGKMLVHGGVIDNKSNDRSSDALLAHTQPPSLLETALRLLVQRYPRQQLLDMGMMSPDERDWVTDGRAKGDDSLDRVKSPAA